MFDRRLTRTFKPLRPVYVDMDQVLPIGGGERVVAVPAVVRKLGLRLHGTMPAEQKAWHRLTDGRWVAAVHVPVECGDRGWIFVDLVVPAEAISPRECFVDLPSRPTNHWGTTE
ncbi:hypothetical protein [Antrihabitans cavernicola]|uniref:Uncharacterized protein n=1 Tax=Antrihabitans cavernicola TaxID=2495913 RepID=A0A5A7S7D6_9NOCA|nr:hypothetical protein [Spelaeibacter cavernicola]KAA0020088.1 hypothetical protein FOY51_22270 [Spelaeibacter cavernicola]